MEKAGRLLQEADILAGQGMYESSGRNSYLAAFHAAQAVVFEKQGRTAKTHGGVHSAFQQLTKDDPEFDPELRKFLSQSYNLKRIADYETGSQSFIPSQRALEAVAQARRFVERCSHLLP